MARKTLPLDLSVENAPNAAERKRGPVAADRIRKTARDLFYREGIRAVGVDEIVTKAGVTKPSLYRSFSSKDELAAAYLRDYDGEFWARFDARRGGASRRSEGAAPGLSRAASRSGRSVRTIAAAASRMPRSNIPTADHPARLVAEDHKQRLRMRLAEMAKGMGAQKPEVLADGLLLLIEGVFVTGQLFGAGGPAMHAVEIAATMIDASRR